MENTVKVISAAQGEFLGVAGDNYRVIIDGAGTSNSFSVFDMTIPPAEARRLIPIPTSRNGSM